MILPLALEADSGVGLSPYLSACCHIVIRHSLNTTAACTDKYGHIIRKRWLGPTAPAGTIIREPGKNSARMECLLDKLLY